MVKMTMSRQAPGRRRTRAIGVGIATAAMLATGARASTDELAPADESPAEIAARASESADELAASVRALEGSLSSAAPAVEGSRVLNAEENDALVEVRMKQQLAGLADDLDQLSAALASGADPAGEKVLIDRLIRRAGVISQLGARSSGVPLPPELSSDLLALRSDMKALSASLDAAPAAEAETESP